jgi:hypothetical protein
LTPASETRDAIAVVARLGAHAKSQLHGVFTEDEDLLHPADLSFARQATVKA